MKKTIALLALLASSQSYSAPNDLRLMKEEACEPLAQAAVNYRDIRLAGIKKEVANDYYFKVVKDESARYFLLQIADYIYSTEHYSKESAYRGAFKHCTNVIMGSVG